LGAVEESMVVVTSTTEYRHDSCGFPQKTKYWCFKFCS